MVRSEMRQQGASNIHQTKQVHVKLFTNLFPRRRLEQSEQPEASVVDQDVYFSEFLNSGTYRLIDARHILNIKARDQHVFRIDQLRF